MKKLFSVFFVAAMAMGCFAQESYTLTISDWQWSDHCNSISIAAGAPSVVSYVEQSLAFDRVAGERPNLYSLGAYQLRYDYNVLRWLAVGGRLSYDGWICSSNSTQTVAADAVQRMDAHRLSVLMELIFTYINREHVTLYSGLALGMSQYWERQTLGDGTLDPRHLSHLAGSLIPIGVRVGGRNVYGMAEVTIGSESIMSVGLGVKF